MFAHQVIEDIDWFLGKVNMLKKREEFFYWIKENIQNSIQFHMGIIPSHVNNGPFKIQEGRNLFSDPWDSYHLPYLMVWFDWNHGDNFDGISKQGLLAIEGEGEEGNLFEVFAFQFFTKINRWIPSVNAYSLSNKGIKVCNITDNGNAENEIDQGILTKFEKSIKLLSCKNIGLEVINPSIQLNKKRLLKHKQPLFSYHILYLKPTTQKEKSIPQYLWDNRIHLCRGHFKSYTLEHPLFGKLTGRYWWQAQARGNKKLGIVVKDYELKGNSTFGSGSG